MGGLTHSELLRYKIDLAKPGLSGLWAGFWAHPGLDRLFPTYMTALYHSMRATVPLLRAAEDRARALAGTDAVAARLVPYLGKHAEEEAHHDEWLLEDVTALGMDPETVRSSLPPAEVAAMIGTQYYLILHVHPVALLGCFAVLEGNPMSVDELDRVSKSTSISGEALRTLYKHARLDPHHRDDLDALLDALPLTREHEELLGLSAIATLRQLGTVIERVLEAAPRAVSAG